MKIALIGDHDNGELYRFMGMLEASGLKAHRYMAVSTDGSQFHMSDIMPDEMVSMVESENGLVLKSSSENKFRATHPSAIEKSDFIIIEPEQLYELADLLPDESLILVLVMEHSGSDKDAMSETDKKLQDIFDRFTKEISLRTHAAAIYKHSLLETDCTKLAGYIAKKKKAHENLRAIIWELIESGNIEVAGDMDTNGRPLRHDKTYKIIQYEVGKEQPGYVPIDLFVSNVMYDDEGFNHVMRIWLESGVDVTECCNAAIEEYRKKEESGDEMD